MFIKCYIMQTPLPPKGLLPMNGIHPAFLHAFPALDAFHVPHMPDIHLTGVHAQFAVRTHVMVHLHSQQGYRGKEGIDRTQGT